MKDLRTKAGRYGWYGGLDAEPRFRHPRRLEALSKVDDSQRAATTVEGIHPIQSNATRFLRHTHTPTHTPGRILRALCVLRATTYHVIELQYFRP